MTYIFIGGSQRSGTSLLSKVLCSGEDSQPHLAECSYFRRLVSAFVQTLQQAPDEVNSYFDSKEDFILFHRSILKSFLDKLQAKYQSKHLVLKEPHLTPLLPFVSLLLPESKFVMIVRDPRDTVVSMLKVKERMLENGGRHAYTRMQLLDFAYNYMSFYAPVLNEQNPKFKENRFFIRYENLVNDPEGTVAEICRRTGLVIDNLVPDTPFERTVTNKDSQRTSFWMTDLSQQGISKQNAGQFVSYLTPEQIKKIEDYPPVRSMMELFDYPVFQPQ